MALLENEKMMVGSKVVTDADMKKPLSLMSQDFTDNKKGYFKWLRENDPVHHGRLMGPMKGYFLTRYDDCVDMLKDPRFVRNRSTATGRGGRFPFPVPKFIQALTNNMINEDEPEHRRLRTLVHKAFTPRQLGKLEDRVHEITKELLDKAEKKGEMELMTFGELPVQAYAVATELESGGVKVFGDDPDTPLVDALMASGAIVPLHPPWDVGGVQYIDGGFSAALPLRQAVERGATAIVLVICLAAYVGLAPRIRKGLA